MRPRVRGWGRTRHTSSAARSCVHGGHSSARSSYPYTGGWEGYDLADNMDPNLNHERLGWMKHKLESRLQGKNIDNLRYAEDTTLMAESKEELKSLLMRVKEESEKAGLKLSIQKTKIMATGPITSWQKDGETMETMTDFILGGSKVTADGDFGHEIKRCLLLGRKAMTNLDHIL